MKGSVQATERKSNLDHASFRSYLIVGSLVLVVHVFLLYGFAKIGLSQYSVRGDGREYMAAAVALAQGRIIGTHFPLYSALIVIVSALVPIDLAALSIPPLFHTFFALVVYRILVAMKFRRPLSGAIMVALLPPSAIVYTSSALADSITLFFVALTFYYGLNGREKLMLVAAFLAGFTHYDGIVLAIPLAYLYWKSNRRKLPLAAIPAVPIILLALYQFVVTGNLLYYVSVHFVFYQRVFGTTPLSYPFESLVYIATALRGIDRIYWFGYVGLAFIVYAIGVARSARVGRNWSAMFSGTFYALTALYTGYYFIPRFLLYAFPSLMEFTELGRRRILWWILIAATVMSVAYSFWFLLVRVPASGFIS